MALTITVKELAVTGPFGGDHCERSYSIIFDGDGTPTDELAFYALTNNTTQLGLAGATLSGTGAPAMWIGTPLDVDQSEAVPTENPRVWTGRAVYGKTSSDSVFSNISEDEGFVKGTTRGGKQTVTQSIATVASSGAPDEGGAIGFDGEKVSGVEIEIGSAEWSITKRVTSGNHATFFSFCNEATGGVNSTTFKGYPAGSVKFLGADFEGKDGDDFIYTLYYAYSPNKTLTINLNGVNTIVTKAGWDVLDVRYGQKVDGTSKSVLLKPKYAYVHQVLPRGNLPS